MTAFVLLSIALCALALALLMRHLWWPFGASQRAGSGDSVRSLGQQLKQLRGLHASGVLGDTQFAEGKAAIEHKLLDAVSPATPARSGAAQASHALAGAVAVFVLIVAGAGYRFVGSPDHLDLGPGAASTMADAHRNATNPDDATAGAPHPVTSQQIEAMVAGLAERLKAKPNDGEGWVMLARSYVALGKHVDAVGAFRQASALRPDDADLLADFADALAVVNNRGLQGEPIQIVARALKIDANNVKALSLAGTAAFDSKDFAGAVKYWEQAIQVETPGSAFAQQLRSGIAEARQLAGMPAPSFLAADGAAAATPAQPLLTAPAQVSGIVTLAPGLKGRVSPEDTVFVFARATDGPRMPLAILRKQVKDLPLKFTLDDSMAMSPESKLSGVSRVTVGARISKSGNAMPQAGDLQGTVSGVTVGTTELEVEIDQEVVK